MAAQDPQSRRWSLTINNPKDCGLDHDTIIERLHLFHPRYFCLADEIGESGTYHTHIYLFSHSPIRFSTIAGFMALASGQGEMRKFAYWQQKGTQNAGQLIFTSSSFLRFKNTAKSPMKCEKKL